ncbi:SubName: Full=Uncharacterized protein {ECO:0000313/EMBL:CCA70481.1} [Serendipita indica DSM 11827]|nr:SubName: Full=Uncharacterized protein {ECO:0000313/EMBL:CCA70481.1} [Serendipita indica DSM 11827]
MTPMVRLRALLFTQSTIAEFLTSYFEQRAGSSRELFIGTGKHPLKSKSYNQPLACTSSSAMSESGDSDVTDDFELFPSRAALHPDAYAHPIASYPQEILGRIFLFWRDGVWARHLLSGLKGGHHHFGMHAPFVLSSVCRTFREAAHSTPDLWSFLYIDCSASKNDYNSKHLLSRLKRTVELAGDTTRLTLCFQALNVDAFDTGWFRGMQALLEPLRTRWGSIIVSFGRNNDLSSCWNIWPLAACNVSVLRLLGSVEEQASIVPRTPFLSICTSLVHLELRNVAYVHQNGVRPRADFNHASLSLVPERHQASSTRVRELWPHSHAQPWPNMSQLGRLESLTVSPVLLRTSLQGLQQRPHLPALMRVSIHFTSSMRDDAPEGAVIEPDDLSGECSDVDGDDDECSENARRVEDLCAVGTFLSKSLVETLTLRGLDRDFDENLISEKIIQPMNTTRLKHLCLKECSEHTTQVISVVLRPSRIFVNSGRHSPPERAGYLTHLHSLKLIKCRQVDGPDVVKLVRNAPHWLKVVEMRDTDIDDESYEEIQAILSERM